MIGPWNFPLAIPIGGALAALAAGNAVVLKPAPQTPAVAFAAAAACRAAGIPPDVLLCVRCPDGPVGASSSAIGTWGHRPHRVLRDSRALRRPGARHRRSWPRRRGRTHWWSCPRPTSIWPPPTSPAPPSGTPGRSARPPRWPSWWATSPPPRASSAQLVDAVRSLQLGPATDPAHRRWVRWSSLRRRSWPGRLTTTEAHQRWLLEPHPCGHARPVVARHPRRRRPATGSPGRSASGRCSVCWRPATSTRRSPCRTRSLRADRRHLVPRPGRLHALGRPGRGRQRLRQPPHHRGHRRAASPSAAGSARRSGPAPRPAVPTTCCSSAGSRTPACRCSGPSRPARSVPSSTRWRSTLPLDRGRRRRPRGGRPQRRLLVVERSSRVDHDPAGLFCEVQRLSLPPAPGAHRPVGAGRPGAATWPASWWPRRATGVAPLVSLHPDLPFDPRSAVGLAARRHPPRRVAVRRRSGPPGPVRRGAGPPASAREPALAALEPAVHVDGARPCSWAGSSSCATCASRRSRAPCIATAMSCSPFDVARHGRRDRSASIATAEGELLDDADDRWLAARRARNPGSLRRR